ncbi:hypothetical protein UT300012_24360 [Paraclostridium bifermentans]
MKGFSKGILKWILTFIVMYAGFRIILPQFFSLGYVPSGSMEPTLNIKDWTFCVNVRWAMLDRGDIIVFNPNKEEGADQLFVKRLIGLPGDRVRIEHGEVSVNGKKLDEPYKGSTLDYTGSFVVPKNKFFLLGDNRGDSLDARFWEDPFVSEKQLKYEVKARLIPIGKIKIYNGHKYE